VAWGIDIEQAWLGLDLAGRLPENGESEREELYGSRSVTKPPAHAGPASQCATTVSSTCLEQVVSLMHSESPDERQFRPVTVQSLRRREEHACRRRNRTAQHRAAERPRPTRYPEGPPTLPSRAANPRLCCRIAEVAGSGHSSLLAQSNGRGAMT